MTLIHKEVVNTHQLKIHCVILTLCKVISNGLQFDLQVFLSLLQPP
ncbi:hypothetical protein IX308_001900 [Porphyromonas levii]|nr:hypothetical protein [Porphyromonas levii]